MTNSKELDRVAVYKTIEIIIYRKFIAFLKKSGKSDLLAVFWGGWELQCITSTQQGMM